MCEYKFLYTKNLWVILHTCKCIQVNLFRFRFHIQFTTVEKDRKFFFKYKIKSGHFFFGSKNQVSTWTSDASIDSTNKMKKKFELSKVPKRKKKNGRVGGGDDAITMQKIIVKTIRFCLLYISRFSSSSTYRHRFGSLYSNCSRIDARVCMCICVMVVVINAKCKRSNKWK